MCQLTALILISALGAAPESERQAPTVSFKVENAVYIGAEKKPICQSTTIFHNGVVYDFLQQPKETTVFETASGRFILLNPFKRNRAEFTVGELSAFVDRLQELAVKSDDPVVNFLAAPKFNEREDRASGVLTLESPLVVYRLKLSPERDENIARQYHEFSDWYARLNALISPGPHPPFGRLVVNAALAQRNATAAEVTLTLQPGKSKQKPVTIRSEHSLTRPLNKADFMRVDTAKKQMVGFKAVRFAEYRKTDVR